MATVKAIRIYSTDRQGDKRVSVIANENSWNDDLRVHLEESVATVYDKGNFKVAVHGWNHVEHLDEWDPPVPETAQNTAPEPAPMSTESEMF